MNRTLAYLTALSMAVPMLAGIARAADAPKPEPVSPPRPGNFVQPGANPLARLLLRRIGCGVRLQSNHIKPL